MWQEGGAKPEVGAAVCGRVLDVSKADGIVDLSLAAALLPPAGGKKKEPKGDKWKVGRASFSSISIMHALSHAGLLPPAGGKKKEGDKWKVRFIGRSVLAARLLF